MSRDRLDAIFDRLDALLAEADDPEHRKEIREIQQLVIGVREDRTTGGAAGSGDGGEDGSADTQEAGRGDTREAGRGDTRTGDPADED